jgi:hypothetical protein
VGNDRAEGQAAWKAGQERMSWGREEMAAERRQEEGTLSLSPAHSPPLDPQTKTVLQHPLLLPP